MRQAGRRQLSGCFLCNLHNPRAQKMNKQNYTFANRNNARDAEEEFFPRQESSQGKSQPRFGVCTFPSLYFRGPPRRVYILCFHCIYVLEHASGPCCFVRLHGRHIFERVCVGITVLCKRNSKFSTGVRMLIFKSSMFS